MEPFDSAVVDHRPTGNQSAIVPEPLITLTALAAKGWTPRRPSKRVSPYGAIWKRGRNNTPHRSRSVAAGPPITSNEANAAAVHDSRYRQRFSPSFDRFPVISLSSIEVFLLH